MELKPGWLALTAIVMTACLALAACDYGRMYDQDSVRTYEREMPKMDPRTIPAGGGFETLATADPERIKNPLLYSRETTTQGSVQYGYFCAQCHGPEARGYGTVGQSFAPLPTSLLSSAVQSQTDGVLYAKIRLGFKRHPRLFATIAADDTWAVIVYLRSLVRGVP
jgi:mono/diheme cytochrome c family protein